MNATRADRRWIALYVLCTGMLMIVLDVTVVNVALPSVQRSLGFAANGLAWVVNAYLIAFGGLLLLSGRLGDLFGRRRIFLCGLAVFTGGSLACGLAQDQTMLVVSRFVQGAGGALTSAVVLGMIVTMFPAPAEQAKAIGIFAFIASAGGGIGLLAGGTLTQAVNWHWIFFINVPIGTATAVLARRYVEDDRRAGAAGGVDVAGAILVTGALMLGVYTIVQPAARYGWGSPRTLAFALASAALLVGFLGRQATAAAPLLPLRVFRSRNVCGANLLQIFGAAAMFGTFFLGALYAQRVLAYPPLQTGLAFLPVPVAMGVLSVRYTERLIGRYGPRRLCIVGMSLIAVALVVLAQVPVSGSYWSRLLPAFVLIGVGGGTCFPSLMALAMSGTGPEDAGLASGLANTTAQVGGALGLAVIATLSSSRAAHLLAQGHPRPAALTAGYHLGFLVGAGLAMVGVAMAATVLSRPAPGPEGTVEVATEAGRGTLANVDEVPVVAGASTASAG